MLRHRKKNQRRNNFHILTLYISGGWDSGITHAEVWSVCVCVCVCVCVGGHTQAQENKGNLALTPYCLPLDDSSQLSGVSGPRAPPVPLRSLSDRECPLCSL